jgi:hypothetical protein
LFVVAHPASSKSSIQLLHLASLCSFSHPAPPTPPSSFSTQILSAASPIQVLSSASASSFYIQLLFPAHPSSSSFQLLPPTPSSSHFRWLLLPAPLSSSALQLLTPAPGYDRFIFWSSLSICHPSLGCLPAWLLAGCWVPALFRLSPLNMIVPIPQLFFIASPTNNICYFIGYPSKYRPVSTTSIQ